jgi:hypothetical protein
MEFNRATPSFNRAEKELQALRKIIFLNPATMPLPGVAATFPGVIGGTKRRKMV